MRRGSEGTFWRWVGSTFKCGEVSADSWDGQVEDLEKLAPQLLLDF